MIPTEYDEIEALVRQAVSDYTSHQEYNIWDVDLGEIQELEDHIRVKVFGTADFLEDRPKAYEGMVMITDEGYAEVLRLKFSD
ncbi:MAG: hypothetical protein MRY83_08750 [Flavobacteriales bacterium]|nr:hypothetical protein [Flavobacteriales bacterium]